MSQRIPARGPAALAALLALTVSAQTAPAPAPAPAPATPAAVPGTYRSALEDYQPYSESKSVPWKESNDTVGRIGGWRAYAKEAAEGQAAGAPAPAASGAADPHAGHGKH